VSNCVPLSMTDWKLWFSKKDKSKAFMVMSSRVDERRMTAMGGESHSKRIIRMVMWYGYTSVVEHFCTSFALS
jgi:hypothetical protein